jgi:hypothetical protein
VTLRLITYDPCLWSDKLIRFSLDCDDAAFTATYFKYHGSGLGIGLCLVVIELGDGLADGGLVQELFLVN